MKVILTERVNTLGSVGEVVNVSQGYARNFLIPGGLAVLADESNKKQAAHHDKMLAKKVAAEKAAAVELKGKIEGLTLELVKKVGGTGKLFGTVTNAELAKELENKGIVVERRLISLAPIKALGSFDVKAKLFKDVEASFKVNVIIDPKQAEEIKAKQEAAAKKAEEKALAAETETTEEVEEVKELTEEEKLKEEANKILRG
jgi:large subunit ribosomal protein L9